MRASTFLLLCALPVACLAAAQAGTQDEPSPQPVQNVGSKDGHDQGHQGPTDAIVFLVVALLLGVFTHHVLSFTRIPYTNLLLVRLSDDTRPPMQ